MRAEATDGCHDLPQGYAGNVRNLYTSTCIDVYGGAGCTGDARRILSNSGDVGAQWRGRIFSWEPCVEM